MSVTYIFIFLQNSHDLKNSTIHCDIEMETCLFWNRERQRPVQALAFSAYVRSTQNGTLSIHLKIL